MKSIETTKTHSEPFTRTFRDLSDDEIKDPETLASLPLLGWSGSFDWSELLKSERIMLLSEAGTGKTYECQAQAQRLNEAGVPAFFLPLEALARDAFDNILSPEEARRFQSWRNDASSEAWFFLDSIDEMILSHGKFRTALRQLARAIDGQLKRARIVVTSRPIPIDAQTFADELPIPSCSDDTTEAVDAKHYFRSLISGEAAQSIQDEEKAQRSPIKSQPLRTVALMPLSNSEIRAFVTKEGVDDSGNLVTEIERRRMWDFARRPQDLIEICAYWKEHNALGSRAQQVAQNIANKLREVGERRHYAHLSDARALEGAERLALAMVLTRKKTIRISDNSMDAHEAEAALDPNIILSDWSDADRLELLQRPLFGFSSYGRVRFHHRSVFEYLAARRLQNLVTDKRMPMKALYRLLFAEKYGQQIICPSMRPIVAWLSLWNNHICSEAIEREPEVLMECGDPESLSLPIRATILSAFVKRYSAGGWRGIHISVDQVRRFADPKLSPVVRRLWDSGIENVDVKELLIGLIYTGRMVDCLDVAHNIAVDASISVRDRVTALCALAEMEEPAKFKPIIDHMLASPEDWPERIRCNVLDLLFPRHISVAQFCLLLSQISDSRNHVDSLDWHLPKVVAQLDIGESVRTELRKGIADLIRANISHSKDAWPHYQSKYRHLTQGLAAVCLIDLNAMRKVDGDLISDCVIANRFNRRDHGDEKLVESLRAFFRSASAPIRAQAYHKESEFCLHHDSSDDGWHHAHNTRRDSLVGELNWEDFNWLIDELHNVEQAPIVRAGILEHCLSLSRDESGVVTERIEKCRAATHDSIVLLTTIADWIKPRKPNKEREASERKWKARSEGLKRAEEKRISQWEEWRVKLIADPAPFFCNDALDQAVYDFWVVMKGDCSESGQRTGWNKQVIADSFNADIADQVARAYRAYWRKNKVPLRTERDPEQRQTIKYIWLYGLAGVYAEASIGPNWANSLSSREAELAARYVPMELNGVPAWTSALIAHWPDETDHILGEELSRQLAFAREFEHAGLLSDFFHAAEDVQRFFAQRVWKWLEIVDCPVVDKTQETHLHNHLEKAIALRLRHAPDGKDEALLALAQSHLQRGLDKPFALLWVNASLVIDPSRGVELLERGLSSLSGHIGERFAETFFADLGGRNSISFGPKFDDDAFTADLLLQLLKMAYRWVTKSQDIDRSGQSGYSPTTRDDAQRGRSVIFNTLMAKTGSDAWQAKLAIAKEPLFDHFKDRMLQMARESAAVEAEPPPASDADIRLLDKYGEPAPSHRDGMFVMMMDRIGDLEHDLLHEFSERSLLATISDETMMQQSLAKRLSDMANHAYRVDREAEVVGGTKTDIRLLSVRSDQQAVIELKLGDKKRSAKALVDALRSQLVGQYMKHENCRAGCLLITLAKPRMWQHPETKANLNFLELIAFLNAEAEKICIELAGATKLAVFGLDLRLSVNLDS